MNVNVIGPSLWPVVEIKRLTLDDVEAIKVSLKAKHEIPEFKYSPVDNVLPKLNEEPQQSRVRIQSVESIQEWRSHSEDASTKCADNCQKWEHQLQIQGISSLFPDSQTIWKPPHSCSSSSTPSMVLDSDVSVKEEMEIEDNLVRVDDCASLREFLLDPPEESECFVQSEYPCYKCEMVFPKSDLLLHHLKTHRTTQASYSVFSPKRSPLFSKSTPFRKSASNCIDLLLSKKLKHVCEYCGRGFSRPNYLELHLRAFFRNRTCDKMVFPRKKYKTLPQVQSEQNIGSSLNSNNLLVSDEMKPNPIEDQNFVRAMMMHVAATAEDCFNKSKSELHEDEVSNSQQSGKETAVHENTAPSICEESGSTIGSAQNMSKVSLRKEGACEVENVNDVFQSTSGITANLGSPSMRIGGRIICDVCSRRFKSPNHLKLHYRAHYKMRNITEQGNLMSTNSIREGPPLLKSEKCNITEKGNLMSVNSTNEVSSPLLQSVNDQSFSPSSRQVCEKHYKGTNLLKEHEMIHNLEASGASSCSNIDSEHPIHNSVLIVKDLHTNSEHLTGGCEGGSNMSGKSTGPNEQPLESQKNEKKICAEVRGESTIPPNISKQNVQSGDVPSKAKEHDVSQGFPLGSCNVKEFSCYVCLEKLELVTETVALDDLKSVVKSDYRKESRVKKSPESENSVKMSTTSSNISNNNEGSGDSCVKYGKTLQTPQNISYRKTGNNSRKVKEVSSESFESSMVSSASGYKKRYRCRLCKRKDFKLRKDYVQHRKRGCNASVTSCPLCGARFYKKFLLVAHMSQHFKSLKGVWTFILNRAVRGTFSKNKKRNSVRKSSLVRSKTNSVLQHDVPSNKNSGKVLPHLKKKQKKPLCLLSQKQDQNILNYSGKVVRRKLKRCTNSVVRKLENLRIHNCKTVTLAENTVKCVVCDKSFGSLKALKLHERVHARNVKPQCFVCKEEFDMVLALRLHLRTHFKKVKSCNLCGKEFPNLSSLLSHCSVHKKA